MSTPEKPKPYLMLLGERTLFQQALERVADPLRFEAPLIVAGVDHQRWVAEQSAGHRSIVEPVARNTAPAIALAAARLAPQTIMLVCPSDHYIADNEAFVEAACAAAALASKDHLVCIGVEPDHPETGYGYIERGEKLADGYRIERFVEKPDAETAAAYLASGGFLFNAGIFAFKAGQFLKELELVRPEMVQSVRSSVASGRERGCNFYPAADAFSGIVGESIDYALMENTKNAAVVAADMGWSDIGSWASLMDARERSGIKGGANVIDCRRVMVQSDGPSVSAIGLEDLIIVVEGNEVLVVARESAQQVVSLGKARGK